MDLLRCPVTRREAVHTDDRHRDDLLHPGAVTGLLQVPCCRGEELGGRLLLGRSAGGRVDHGLDAGERLRQTRASDHIDSVGARDPGPRRGPAPRASPQRDVRLSRLPPRLRSSSVRASRLLLSSCVHAHDERSALDGTSLPSSSARCAAIRPPPRVRGPPWGRPRRRARAPTDDHGRQDGRERDDRGEHVEGDLEPVGQRRTRRRSGMRADIAPRVRRCDRRCRGNADRAPDLLASR